MKIAAFDLATQTGWCLGRPGDNAPPVLGSVRMPSTGNEIGPFIHFFDAWLLRWLEKHEPDVIVFEAPILPGRLAPNGKTIATSIHTTRKLQGLASHLEFVCYEHGLRCHEVTLQQAKKALGSGKFSKDEMMAAARRAGMDPAGFDEADAFGVWICALRKLAPEHQRAWDERLSRGLV